MKGTQEKHHHSRISAVKKIFRDWLQYASVQSFGDTSRRAEMEIEGLYIKVCCINVNVMGFACDWL